MTGLALIQVAQRVDNLERATDFYSALLGASPLGRFDPPGLVFFDLDGVRLLLERGAPSAVLYLLVDDLESAIHRPGEIEVVSPAHLIFTHTTNALGPAGREEWHAFIRDPEGNIVGLVEYRNPSA